MQAKLMMGEVFETTTSGGSVAAQGLQILLEFRHVVMRSDAPTGEKMLEGQRAHPGEGSGLNEGEAVLRKEQDRQFLLELGRRQVRGVQCFIGDYE